MKQCASILWGEEILKAGHNLRIIAEGSSMLPSIRGGDVIIIKPINVVDLKIGDIIIRRTGNKLIAHRLIKKKNIEGILFLITKGDNLHSADQPLKASQLLGKVVSIERGFQIIQLDTTFQQYRNKILALRSSLFILR